MFIKIKNGLNKNTPNNRSNTPTTYPLATIAHSQQQPNANAPPPPELASMVPMIAQYNSYKLGVCACDSLCAISALLPEPRLALAMASVLEHSWQRSGSINGSTSVRTLL